MIKVMNLVAILAAPIAIQPISVAARTVVVVISVIALVAATLWSKRGGIEAGPEAGPENPNPVPESEEEPVAV